MCHKEFILEKVSDEYFQHNHFPFFLTRQNVYYYTCTKQKVPESTEPWVTLELWVLSMKLATCQPSGTWKLEVALRFLGSLWTPAEDTDTAAQALQQRSS